MLCLIVSVEPTSGSEETGNVRMAAHMTVSAINRMMESVSGENGLNELIAEGRPVEFLVDDRDNT
ncbi:hypothetical protein DPMN_097621 [Dreissena polymorpha]|uniref:Uncharacterized protein n=1 Tax=Dreissena polymorpha TaxID=45954 RepID=A0A9D4R4Q7_DREPO|nr:hypothetical protein DPMN_097621 [Dreissena polymorpha]